MTRNEFINFHCGSAGCEVMRNHNSCKMSDDLNFIVKDESDKIIILKLRERLKIINDRILEEGYKISRGDNFNRLNYLKNCKDELYYLIHSFESE